MVELKGIVKLLFAIAILVLGCVFLGSQLDITLRSPVKFQSPVELTGGRKQEKKSPPDTVKAKKKKKDPKDMSAAELSAWKRKVVANANAALRRSQTEYYDGSKRKSQ